jgi:hypothetical protein
MLWKPTVMEWVEGRVGTLLVGRRHVHEAALINQIVPRHNYASSSAVISLKQYEDGI